MELQGKYRINDRTAQQLVSYEAIFKLLDEMQPLEDIADISNRVAKQWKYFANVACWHLFLPLGDTYKVIDGYRGTAQVADLSFPSPWDSYQFQSQLPRLIRRADPIDGPEPPEHFMDRAIVEIQVLPFVRVSRCIGILSVAARNEPFSELDNKFIRIFGSHFTDRVFDILLRKQSLDALRNKATYDALTGLLNRGAIIERLEMLLELSRRTKDALTIIIADIDYFKRVSDGYGHLAGDEVLREVARRLSAQTRHADHLGRYGGEEFLFVLYPCGADSVLIAAERFRKAISDQPIRIGTEDGESLPVTISLGNATTKDDIKPDSLLKRADDALYVSKRAGRDRTTIG